MSKTHRSFPHDEADDSSDAFFADSSRGRGRLPEDAEDLAEEFIATATSAEDAFGDALDELLVEELGGPYLEIDARGEPDWFAHPPNALDE